jgi:TatD DNase family protein
MRGRPNEPAFVRHTVDAVARIKGLSSGDVARITGRNARRLFGIEDPEGDPPQLCYAIRDSLYVNVTNRCTLHCTFCGKFRDFVVKGHNLAVGRDPEPAELRAALAAADPSRYREVVFCGYGEPLLRLDVVKDLARELKAAGRRTRVNTDGLASLVLGRDVPGELAGLIDVASVSLNAPDAATYARHCRSRYGEAAWQAACEFIRRAAGILPEVWATAVELPGLDVDACRRVAEGLGARFRSRPYNDLG